MTATEVAREALHLARVTAIRLRAVVPALTEPNRGTVLGWVAEIENRIRLLGITAADVFYPPTPVTTPKKAKKPARARKPRAKPVPKPSPEVTCRMCGITRLKANKEQPCQVCGSKEIKA